MVVQPLHMDDLGRQGPVRTHQHKPLKGALGDIRTQPSAQLRTLLLSPATSSLGVRHETHSSTSTQGPVTLIARSISARLPW